MPKEMTITIKIKLVGRLKDFSRYLVLTDGRLYNRLSKRFIKRTMRDMVPGYYIGKDFLKLTDLKDKTEPYE